jgi:hypothetical protein
MYVEIAFTPGNNFLGCSLGIVRLWPRHPILEVLVPKPQVLLTDHVFNVGIVFSAPDPTTIRPKKQVELKCTLCALGRRSSQIAK